MEYKRLTFRSKTGRAYDNLPTGSLAFGDDHDEDRKVRRILTDRLAELEDKIEQGTLIELPCKVGAVLYEIVPKCKVGGLDCPYNGGFGTSRCENGCGAYIKETKFTFLSMRELIGKSLFLTREEAEKRLKELQNG